MRTVSSKGLRIVVVVPSSILTMFGLISVRHVVMNAGSSGVVISRTRVGYCSVKQKILVMVIRQSFFVDTESGLPSAESNPLTQASEDELRTSRPPASTIALINTAAAKRPSGALSCSKVDTRVFNLCASATLPLLWPIAWLEAICKACPQDAIEEERKNAIWGSSLTGVEVNLWIMGRKALNSVMVKIFITFL
jgi:hypothetical protein